jgi:hypothetical protein
VLTKVKSIFLPPQTGPHSTERGWVISTLNVPIKVFITASFGGFCYHCWSILWLFKKESGPNPYFNGENQFVQNMLFFVPWAVVCLFVCYNASRRDACICELYWHSITKVTIIIPSTRTALPPGLSQNPRGIPQPRITSTSQARGTKIHPHNLPDLLSGRGLTHELWCVLVWKETSQSKNLVVIRDSKSEFPLYRWDLDNVHWRLDDFKSGHCTALVQMIFMESHIKLKKLS